VTAAWSHCTVELVSPSEPDSAPRPPTDTDERARRGDELAAFVDLLPDGLMAFDRQGRCVLFNAGARQILGRERAEWMGKTLAEVAPAALGSTFDRAFQRCRAERVMTALEQTYYPPRDRWYQSIFRPGPDGGVLLQFRNIAFETRPGRDRGVIPLDLEPSDLTLICRGVIDGVNRDSRERQVLFTSDGDTRGAWDRTWIAQVVTSLLGNAIEGSRPSTAVQVTAREATTDVTLAVQHFGELLSPQQITTLFDPSPRADVDAPARSPDIFGLGLFLTRRIVEAHGGSIRAESDAERGTTLTAQLPRAVAAELRRPAMAT
jgi:PAS domain S-box-containing protein